MLSARASLGVKPKDGSRARPKTCSSLEEQQWAKRAAESAIEGVSSPEGGWRWTLNWNSITPRITVGSCPRNGEDMHRLAKEAGAQAVLCLQSDECIASMNIDMDSIKEAATDAGVLHLRVSVRDFDRADQADTLPEAVRMLMALLATGRKVYVHCTAGINRAPLTVVAYLALVEHKSADEALHVVKTARPIANPYMDSLAAAKAKLLVGRTGEVTALSRSLFEARQKHNKGHSETNSDDWFNAENEIVRRVLTRRAASETEALASATAVAARHGAFSPDGEHSSLEPELQAARRAAIAAASVAAASAAAEASAHASPPPHGVVSEIAGAAAAVAVARDESARLVRGALAAADAHAHASAARQAVLEAEVRRLHEAAAVAVRARVEEEAQRSDVESAALELSRSAAAEVLRLREELEASRHAAAELEVALEEERLERSLEAGLAEQRAAKIAAAATAAAARVSMGQRATSGGLTKIAR